ncbi:MAG TPA: VWA domain-containing protein [Candidatus Acidoferrales bacterium]
MLCLAVASVAVLIASTGLAQSTVPQSTASETPAQALRVSTRLVQVSVIVRHKGAPVTGLTKDDFTILDQNRRQKITAISEQSYEPATKSADAPKNSNAVFSNHFDPNSGAPSSVTIILMDALNTPRQQMANARLEVAKFLQQLQPTERVALYGLSTNLYVIHDFTNDIHSLLAALDQSKKGTNAYQPSAAEVQPSDTGNDNIDAFIDSANQHAADMQTINRAEMTANVMAAIANSVASVPGRKNLVWVSGSFPFQIGTGSSADDPQGRTGSSGGGSPQSITAGPDNTVQFRTFQKELEAASEAVNNANLAIYPVDARGLIGASNVSADKRSPTPMPGSPARSRRPMNATQPAPSRENFDTMIVLAERTGGRAFYNSNDIEYSVRQAVDDSRDSYVLDYYPADTQWDGTFHTIKVEVNRPGVDVRFRMGYFAIPDASTDPLRVEQMMQDAMSSPFQDTDLGLTVETHPGTANGMRQISVRIGVDSNRLHFKKTGDLWMDDLQIVWLQFAADGKPTSARTQSLTTSLTPEEYSQNQRGEVKITRDVPLKNEATKLRIVVRDVSTGTIGSVDIPLAKVFSQPAVAPPTN